MLTITFKKFLLCTSRYSLIKWKDGTRLIVACISIKMSVFIFISMMDKVQNNMLKNDGLSLAFK